MSYTNGRNGTALYMWMGLSYAAIAASLNASDRVGYEGKVRSRSIQLVSDTTYVSMASPRNVLRTRAVLHRENTLADHLTRVRADDVHAEHTVGLRLRDDLHAAVRVRVRLGARVGAERELARLVLGAGSLELLLGLADPGDLGVCVDNRRDHVVVDVAVPGLDVLDRGDALLLGLVRQHRSECDVADALDVLHGRVELVIDDDTTLVVELHADLVKVKAVGVRAAADGDEDDIGLELEDRR
jgi:hypothetical protein